MIRTSSLIICCLSTVAALHGQIQSVWNNAGSGDALWSNPANWSEGVPESNDCWAIFRDNNGSTEVTLDQDVYIERLFFDTRGVSHPGYIIKGDKILTINVNDSAPFRLGILADGEGANTIECPVEINNSQKVATNIQAHSANSQLVFKAAITGTTYINFGGVEGGETVVEGDIINHAGVRFGQRGTVTISGSGVSSGEQGNIVFASGTVNLNRPYAISGRKLVMSEGEGSITNFNSSESIAPDLETFVDGLATWNFQEANQTFGPLTLSSTLEIYLAGNCELIFANSSEQTWTGTLDISGYTSGKNRIRFGTSQKGLNPDQLRRISINKEPAEIDAQGFLRPLK